MGFREKLQKLTARAETAAVEHKDEIRQTIEKAESAVDQQTGGKYRDKIEKVDEKVDAYLENLEPQTVQEPPPAAPANSPAGDNSTSARLGKPSASRERPET